MNSESNKEYSVNWKNHMNHIRKAFDHLFNSNELTDVTLCCEGRKIGAHKILLSACSNYFRDTFKEVPSKHPVVILYGVEFNILLDILHFVYNGEVSVDISKLDDFLKVAQTLQISGLTDKHDGVDTTKIPKEENNPETANSSQDSDETFVEAASPVTHEEVRRPVKRARREATPVTESIQKAEEDSQLISDVKCEPPEILNFENPLTDPLQEDQIQDPHEFFANAAGHNSTVGEFKIERGLLESTPLDTKIRHSIFSEDSPPLETKIKHSIFSEESLKCTECDKVFSHPYSLHHHKAVHSGNTQCPICHAILSRKYNLKMHMKARHNV